LVLDAVAADGQRLGFLPSVREAAPEGGAGSRQASRAP
jgi:hypothetical protein